MSLYETAIEPECPRPDYDPALDEPEPPAPRRVLIDNAPALLQAVADVMNITPKAITGKKKTTRESLARQIVMTLWSESNSLQESCEVAGRTNHSAAVYARSRILSRLQYCEDTKERVKKIIARYIELTTEKTETK